DEAAGGEAVEVGCVEAQRDEPVQRAHDEGARHPRRAEGAGGAAPVVALELRARVDLDDSCEGEGAQERGQRRPGDSRTSGAQPPRNCFGTCTRRDASEVPWMKPAPSLPDWWMARGRSAAPTIATPVTAKVAARRRTDACSSSKAASGMTTKMAK